MADVTVNQPVQPVKICPVSASGESFSQGPYVSKMRLPLKYGVTFVVCLVVLVSFASLQSKTKQDTAPKRYLPHQSELLQQDQGGIKVKDEWLEGVESRQKQRQRRVIEICQRNNINFHGTEIVPEMFRHLFVDDNFQYIYCEVPKVACTNWKRMMLVLSGKVNTTNPEELRADQVHDTLQHKYLRTLDTYTAEEIKYRLQNYYKFMFVRNPLERILSAYKNKFTLKYNSYFHDRYGRKIIKRYRKNPSQKALDQGNDVTFKEFVQYLLDPVTTRREPLNAHWRQFYQLCRPCIVDYTFVGKYESLSEDIDRVLSDLGVEKSIKFPGAPKMGTRPKTIDVLRSSYANITLEEIHKLWELYAVDFALFGYEYPDLETHY